MKKTRVIDSRQVIPMINKARILGNISLMQIAKQLGVSKSKVHSTISYSEHDEKLDDKMDILKVLGFNAEYETICETKVYIQIEDEDEKEEN